MAGVAISSDASRGRVTGLRYAVAVLALAAAYVLLAEIGFSQAFAIRQVTAVWPPTGLAVAILLLGGLGLWPGIALGAFAANALTHLSPLTALCIAFGNTLGPLAAAVMLRRFAVDARLERVRDVLLLATCGATAMLVSATNGVVCLAVAGVVPWHDYAAVWRLWWSGDAMGVLLFAPVILTWVPKFKQGRIVEGRTLEQILFGPVMLAGVWLGFMSGLRLGFLVFPLVIWSALRFPQRVTAASVVVMSIGAILGADRALGPFSDATPDQRLAYVITLMAVLSITGLIVGAMTAERDAAEARRIAAERRALEHVTEVAQTLQAAFLPKRLPERSDVTFDALYLTAGRQELVGGDWYDVFTVPDGQIVISIGDMAGHGVGAAVIAAEIRQRILATAFTTSNPAQTLEMVNDMLGDDPQTLATALVAFVDPAEQRIRYASAGHPPPIISGPTIPPRLLPYGGLPLGVLPRVEFDSTTVELEPGALVVFYTDGVTEINRDPVGGERALVDAIAALEGTGVTLAQLRDRVMGSCDPADDALLVLVRLAPSRTFNDEARRRYAPLESRRP